MVVIAKTLFVLLFSMTQCFGMEMEEEEKRGSKRSCVVAFGEALLPIENKKPRLGNPFDLIPLEMNVEILKRLSSQELREIPGICWGLEQARLFVLNDQEQEIEIKNQDALNSYLTTFSTLPKIRRVRLPFMPSANQLVALGENCLSAIIPAPTGKDKINIAEALLKWNPIALQFVDKNRFLTNWTLEDLKQLWARFENRTDEEATLARSKITKSLETYQHSISLDQLKSTLHQYPFLRNIKLSYIWPRCREVARFIRNNKDIISLNLSWNGIGNMGVKKIAKVLRGNTILTSLDLSRNRIGKEGVIEIAKALESNTTLTFLNLNYNPLTSSGRKVLRQLMNSNPHLRCSSLVQYR